MTDERGAWPGPASERETETRLHEALVAARMAYWQWSPASGRLIASETMGEVFGVPPGETFAGGAQAFAPVDPDDREPHRTAVAEAVREGRGWHRTFRIIRPRDGAIAWVEERATARRDPVTDELVLTGLVIDITERKQAEEALAQAARADAYRVRLADGLRTLADPLDIQDLAVRTLGELLGVGRVHFATVEDGQLVYEREYAPGMVSMLGRHPVPPPGEFHVDAYRAGEVVLCEDVAERVPDPARRAAFERIGVAAFVGVPVMRDGQWVAILTVHDNAPRAWLAAEVALIVETAERTWNAVERAVSTERLRDAIRRKDEFLAVLAHELRNPLAPLRTSIEVLRMAPGDAQLVAESAAMMERQLKHMVRLVDDLLDVSRISSGKMQIHRAPALLSELLRTAVEAHRRAIEDKGVVFETRWTDAPAMLDVDATRIVQVLSNVLHNACKFTPPGGRITLTSAITGAAVVITVQDTGTGMTAELLPHVFEPFTQEPEARSGGLGLGLHIAKRLVVKHGGTIEARSDGPGCGSEVVIRLPVAGAAASPAAGEVAAAPPVALRVAIIDDNPDAARALEMLVRVLGGAAAVAHTSEHGLALVREQRPDVVLLDIGLPDVDGYETCRQIRALLGAAVKIVAVTGWGQPDDKQRAFAAGFDAHLTKPPDPAVLRRVLSR